MPLDLINPDDLYTPTSYHQVAVATGSRMVFVSGQAAHGPDGTLVGLGDFKAQAQLAFANVGRALAAAGAQPDQVARITVYVVGHREELLDPISEARIAVFGDHRPADVVIGVETLAEPGFLIEVDAIAVID
jgi:enamine deaminase RidA (YjgF/YER057c/UK114 family)